MRPLARHAPDPLEFLVDENRVRASCTRPFDVHRRKLIEMVDANGQARRLTVIGAGNCRDWNLRALTQRFDQVTLVDVDTHALDRARVGWGGSGIEFVPGLDALGLLRGAPRSHRLSAACQAGVKLRARLKRADVVVSDFVVSDTFKAMSCSGRPLDAAERLDVLIEHLSTLLELTVPGGRIYLLFQLQGGSDSPPATAHDEGPSSKRAALSTIRPDEAARRIPEKSQHQTSLWSLGLSRSELERTCRAHGPSLRSAQLSDWRAHFTPYEHSQVGQLELRTCS